MPASLPYLSSSGTVDTAFKRMKEAATPTRFTNDFVNAVLQIKGGAGSSIPPFMKKMGLLNADGTPSVLYDRLRNDSTSGGAVAEAIRIGYKPLYAANEYAHKLSDADIKGLIVQVTGLEKDNRVAQLIFGTFKKLCSHASFDGGPVVEEIPQDVTPATDGTSAKPAVFAARGMNLSYTINLNLPPSTNIDVFNAIFRSLKENLLES